MVLLSLWTLGSSAWSDSDSRALLEFDRVLLYAVALALFGTVERTPANVRRMLAGLALGMLVVCGAGADQPDAARCCCRSCPTARTPA